MNVLLVVIGLPLVMVLPGLCTVAALAPLRRLDWPERIYVVLAISTAVSGWLGLILAQIGIFSLWLLLGLLALYSLTLGLLAWRRGRWRWPGPEAPRQTFLVSLGLLALSAVFVGLAFRPFELILGPRDAAVYPATAAQIARHGGIRIVDELVPTLIQETPEDTHNAFVQFFGLQHPGRFYYHYLRMPGFFIADSEGAYIPEFLPTTDGRIVVPQFYHLYPTWLAIGFSLLGVEAGLFVTPYLSLLGGLGAFFLARRLFGGRVALLAYLFLVVQTLQVWFARYSTAEGATQFLMFLALYGLLRLDEDESSRQEPFWGLLAGLALGMIGLVRVEFFFPWLLLLPYLAYRFIARRFRRGHRLMLLALGILALHTLAQFVTLTRGYTIGIYYHRIQDWALLSWLVYPFLTPTLRLYWGISDTPRTPVLQQPGRLAAEIGVLLLLWALLLVLRHAPRLAARLGSWLQRRRHILLGGAALLFFLAFAYLYLIRPGILSLDVLLHPLENRPALEGYIGAPVPEGAAANLVRVGWYFSPLGMLLAAAGIALLLWRESSQRSWFLLLLGLFYLFFFNYEVFGENHHIYIMRRYVPMVVPFFCIAMAYVLEWLGTWGRSRPALPMGATRQVAPTERRAGRPRRLLGGAATILSVLLAGLMVLYLVYTGLPFYRHNEYQGALEWVRALAARFDPQDVIVLIDDARDAPFTIATPLRYLFDRDALVVMPEQPNGAWIEEQMARWQAQGRNVYLLIGNDGGRLFLPQTRLRLVERVVLAVPEFEQLTTQKPHNAYVLNQAFGLYVAERWNGAGSPLAELPLEMDLGSNGYIFQSGGFYGDEATPDGTTYCWTKGEGILRLPWPEEDAAVTVTLRLAGGKRPAELGSAQVTLALGKWQAGDKKGYWQAAQVQLAQGFTAHTVALPLCAATNAHTVRLLLVSPTWKQVDYGLGGDRRPLGVQVDWVRVEAGRGKGH